MKNVPVNLQTKLDSGLTSMAFGLAVIRKDGVVKRWCELDDRVSIDIGDGSGEQTFVPGFDRTNIDSSRDMSVDTVDFTGLLGTVSDDVVTAQDVRDRLYTFAEFYLFQMDYDAPSDGIIKMKRGRVGRALIQDDAVWLFEGRGLSQALKQTFIDVTRPSCRYDLFDSQCTLAKSAFQDFGTVTGVTVARRTFTATLTTDRANYFHSRGVVEWLTGNNVGQFKDVKQQKQSGSDESIELYENMRADIAVGDTFRIQAGCNKSFTAHCIGKFNNGVNFGGEPFNPGNDKIRRTPDAP